MSSKPSHPFNLLVAPALTADFCIYFRPGLALAHALTQGACQCNSASQHTCGQHMGACNRTSLLYYLRFSLRRWFVRIVTVVLCVSINRWKRRSGLLTNLRFGKFNCNSSFMIPPPANGLTRCGYSRARSCMLYSAK